MGIRNKHGIFRKVKWMPNSVVISMKEYEEYTKWKKTIKAVKDLKERFPEAPIIFRLSPDSRLELI